MNLNKLKLNYDKCKYMLFKSSNKEIDDNITFQILLTNSIKLEQVKSLKYLGIVFGEKLKWTNHVQLLCKKLVQVCGILRTIKPLVNSKTLLNVYYWYTLNIGMGGYPSVLVGSVSVCHF